MCDDGRPGGPGMGRMNCWTRTSRTVLLVLVALAWPFACARKEAPPLRLGPSAAVTQEPIPGSDSGARLLSHGRAPLRRSTEIDKK